MLILLYTLTALLLLSVMIPLIRHDNWVFRAMEYPRLQKLALAVVVLLLWFVFGNTDLWQHQLAIGVIVAALAYLTYQVFPYLPVAKREMKAVSSHWQSNNQISLLVSNVYQPNRETARLKKRIEKQQPDIVLLLETDDYWEQEMRVLDQAYPHQVKEPKDNTYGMLLYSRLPLSEVEIKYLVEDDIPSIHAWVHLPSKVKVKLFGLHPRPPVPSENPRSTEKDAELVLVAREVAQLNAPVIVAGDLNDVAWSYTTALFQRLSQMLDPRKGRGFFNTFSANNPLVRIPLDHVFVSDHFKLRKMKRLGHVGSDHFPIYISLEYSNGYQHEQSAPQSTKEDEQLAEEKLREV